ncbi:MAG: thioredoxin fold domain-containing protein [Xanthomonadales bacterium]|nr:thioredoxin fold domain-containing protein [Xanthomonadales bacterium]
MMNPTPLIFAALLSNLMAVSVFAGTDEEASANIIEERVRLLAPNAKTIAVSETPIEGILQVQINSEIVYVTGDGQYLIQGQIMDIDTRTNLTDQAKSGIRVGLLEGLKQEEQISFSPVEPKYELLVFTDLDCGYCRKLHNQMDEYNEEGIAIHYLAFPRAGVGSASYDKFVSVWCADDQHSALTLAKNGGDPEPQKCPNPIADQYELGREIGVTGTPALVTADGTLIPGYMPPAQLRQRLESLQVSAE